MKKQLLLFVTILFYFSISHSAQVTTTLYSTSGDSKPLGKVDFIDTPYGLLITPTLADLPPGLHGFHLHIHPDCGDVGMQAGGHYDPANTNSHQGPYGNGHLGDLPVLYVTTDGNANTPTLAPRLKTNMLKGLSLMIHQGGDNYSDTPPMGGGGARVACGVIS